MVAADNSYLHTKDDVGVGGQKPQHYKYRECKQSNSQLTEENINFAFMNTSNENAGFNLSFHTYFNVPQRENPLVGLPLDSLTTTELCASEDKEKEIVNYSFVSGISELVYQSQSVVGKTVYTRLSTLHYMKTFTSTLQEQNEIQVSNPSMLHPVKNTL
ncbi:hypothetical protein AVEN_84728-1 [Araneus ventricosus]|uniref:Uncharacterized protein n=1 Tax=Araneus ventricosus TaxID=182803 RepID=A0A4Y2K0I3_ARAVE|nr:hypothetical protein AVEN_84728-1 [Araneus ventricosus]